MSPPNPPTFFFFFGVFTSVVHDFHDAIITQRSYKSALCFKSGMMCPWWKARAAGYRLYIRCQWLMVNRRREREKEKRNKYPGGNKLCGARERILIIDCPKSHTESSFAYFYSFICLGTRTCTAQHKLCSIYAWKGWDIYAICCTYDISSEEEKLQTGRWGMLEYGESGYTYANMWMCDSDSD